MTIANRQHALAVASGFVLDQIRTGRRSLDLVDALIVLAVTQTNIEPVLRDPVLQRAYATYEAPPPDDLRRPISINALAQSLGLPFETVRRRVTRLTKLGVFHMGPEGIWSPTNRVLMPLHRRTAEECYSRSLELYERLRTLDEFSHLPVSEPWRGAPPLRAVARLAGEYLLRLVEQLSAIFRDPVSAAVWLELLRCSTENGLTLGANLMAVEPRPVRSAAVARRLGLPNETVRRRVTALAAQGACEQTRRGFLVPMELLSEPDYLTLVDRNLADLRRMFLGFADLGILPVSESGVTAA